MAPQPVIPRFPLAEIARVDPHFHVFCALLPKDERERFEWYGSQRYQPRVERCKTIHHLPSAS